MVRSHSSTGDSSIPRTEEQHMARHTCDAITGLVEEVVTINADDHLVSCNDKHSHASIHMTEPYNVEMVKCKL